MSDLENDAEESVLAVAPSSELVRTDIGNPDDSLLGSEIIGHDGDPFFI
jgi:hypothetical protein